MLHRGGPKNHPWDFGDDTFLRFDSGMQSGRPAAVQRDPSLEFIHHLDGAVFDEVIHVAAEKRVGFEGVLHGGVKPQIALLEKIAAAERVFHRADAGVCKRGVVGARVEGVVSPGRRRRTT